MARAARHRRSYDRRAPNREPYDTILIVCEGEKTEPNYFKGLITACRLSGARIKVMHPPATDPMSLVQFGETQLGNHDRVFCIFDRDGNDEGFRQAVRKIENSEAGRAGRFHAITSVPCFELWVLLHFRYTAAPFTAVGRASACQRVLNAVREHLPDYAKGDGEIYRWIEPRTNAALRHANRLEAERAGAAFDNPSTRMHRLVEYLRTLKQN